MTKVYQIFKKKLMIAISASLILTSGLFFFNTNNTQAGPFGNCGAYVISSTGGTCCMYHWFKCECYREGMACEDAITN